MPSEKFFVHKEDGSLVRLKGRLVRFLDEEPPTGSDKSAIRTALEVSPDAEGLVQADVGTGPQNLVLHQHLGDLAYQSAEGISVGTATIDGDAEIGATSTDHTRLTISSPNNKDGQISFDDSDGSLRGFVVYDHAQEKLKIGSGGANAVYIDSSQRVGIGTASPSTNLQIQTTGSDAVFSLNRTDAKEYRLYVDSNSQLIVRDQSAGSTRFKITATGDVNVGVGNIVMGTSGKGIDFGSAAAAGRTVESGLLSDYEIGTWSPVYSTSAAAMTTPPTMDIIHARYVKVGGLVHVQAFIRTDSVDTSGGSGNLMITGLPFAPHTGSYSSVDISTASAWGTDTPLAGWANPAGITLVKRSSVNGSTSNMSVSDLTNGATTNQNQLIFKAAYYTSA